MTTLQIIQTALECAIVAALIYALFSERRIAIIERRIFRRIKRRFIK